MRFIFVLLLLSVASPSYSATFYMGHNETYSSLESAVAAMSGGDILIIRDGRYSGAANVLDERHMPPSGTAQNPTVIMAENDGGAVFPDSFLFMEASASASHIDFIGLKAESSTVISSGTSYFRIMRCAFTNRHTVRSDESIFSIGGTYHLVEDCWAWGEGRYGMYTSSVGAQYIIFRRCVVRLDKVNAHSPMAPFQSYSNPDIYFQNCIVLDGDDRFWLHYEERASCFYSRTAGPVSIDGSICLNYPAYFAGGTVSQGLYIANSVAWDLGAGAYIDTKVDIDAEWSISHVTIGEIDGFDDPVTGATIAGGSGVLSKNGTFTGLVTNSILTNISDAGSSRDTAALDGSTTTSNYNVLYGNLDDYQSTSAGTNDYCSDNSNGVDPQAGSLEYLPRIEDDSALDGAASDGSDIGATILYKIGEAGTFYGDTGWQRTTTEKLWPWPNEDRLKADMASYSYTGVDRDGNTNQTLSGVRGFAAGGKQLNGVDDITLTSYIWEYLGNPIPENIYGDGSEDTEVQSPRHLQIQN